MTNRFSSGDKIPETGVYYVYHPIHRLVRSVRLLEGDLFPRCSQCVDRAEFELVMAVRDPDQYEPLHIFELPLHDEEAEASEGHAAATPPRN